MSAIVALSVVLAPLAGFRFASRGAATRAIRSPSPHMLFDSLFGKSEPAFTHATGVPSASVAAPAAGATRTRAAEARRAGGTFGCERKECSRHLSPASKSAGSSYEWSSGQTKGCGISTLFPVAGGAG